MYAGSIPAGGCSLKKANKGEINMRIRYTMLDQIEELSIPQEMFLIFGLILAVAYAAGVFL